MGRGEGRVMWGDGCTCAVGSTESVSAGHGRPVSGKAGTHGLKAALQPQPAVPSDFPGHSDIRASKIKKQSALSTRQVF